MEAFCGNNIGNSHACVHAAPSPVLKQGVESIESVIQMREWMMILHNSRFLWAPDDGATNGISHTLIRRRDHCYQ
jgi:hypothetical protein